MTLSARPSSLLAAVVAVLMAVTPPGLGAPSTRDPSTAGHPFGLPPDLPLDREGVPTRPLSDEELWRLLLALSATNEAATARIVRCHMAGTPHGHPAWRACLQAR